MRAARERVAALEEEEQRAREEAERLRQSIATTTRAYQDGPGPITLEGAAARRPPEPRARRGTPMRLAPGAVRRLLLGALGLIVVILIIIAASH